MSRDSLNVGTASITLQRGDITAQDVDAIVNAANSGLLGGGGVDGAIHRAGGSAIFAECKAIVNQRGRLPAGQAVITTAGQMTARKVIHTVGPIWHGGSHGEAETLASAYRESLRLANEYALETVAFPSISTGAYGYPVAQAAGVALGAVRDTLLEMQSATPPCSVHEVRFVLFDEATYAAYAAALDALLDS